MIKFRLKIFTEFIEKIFVLNSKQLFLKQSKLVLLNLIKLFELYNLNGGAHINHWLNKVNNSLLILYKNNDSYQSFYSLLDPKHRREFIGLNEEKNLIEEAGGSKDYEILLGDIVKEFLNTGSSKETGQEAKYGHLYVNNDIKKNRLFKLTKNKYPVYIKYIALCLSGQLCPDDWWYEINNISKMEIDYSIKHVVSKEESKEIIAQCLEYIISDLEK